MAHHESHMTTHRKPSKRASTTSSVSRHHLGVARLTLPASVQMSTLVMVSAIVRIKLVTLPMPRVSLYMCRVSALVISSLRLFSHTDRS
jgi:hypothetical protein